MSQFELVLSPEFDRDDAVRDRLCQALAAHIPVSRPQFLFRKSADPQIPALIEVAAVLAVWHVLVPAAAAYFERLAEHAADATWAALRARLTKSRAEPIADIAQALADSAGASASNVEVRLTLRLPGERSGPGLVVVGQDPETIARCLAAFVVHGDGVQQELLAAISDGRRPLGEPRVALTEDGGLVVTWVCVDGTECRRQIT